MLRIVNVVGARPNLMKIAPLVEEMKRYAEIEQILVHTGQHYDHQMSRIFFDQLDIPEPDIYLGVGSGSHSEQTAKVMMGFEPVVLEKSPDLVVVVGDVNSTLACALVAAKLNVKVGHVEAGLRSFDRTMPEEINRILTDHVADLLFTTEREANKNLLREGIAEHKIHFVGDVMIDTLIRHKDQALALDVLGRLGVSAGEYALLTLHRPSNVDDPHVLNGILDALKEIQTLLPVIFPAHPRTVKRLREFSLHNRLTSMQHLTVLEPYGYLEFLNLMMNAKLVLTDSGGIQEETTLVGVPCLTLRMNTERPVTLNEGTNKLVGCNPENIVAHTVQVLRDGVKAPSLPELWDGRAAERIVGVILKEAKCTSG
jgi:UDP-N-acetylglucosamine 2-epimerase (non-hydrolysing)